MNGLISGVRIKWYVILYQMVSVLIFIPGQEDFVYLGVKVE